MYQYKNYQYQLMVTMFPQFVQKYKVDFFQLFLWYFRQVLLRLEID